MKRLLIGAAALVLASQTSAQPAPEITVPAGFRVQVVHEGVGPARHITVRPNGDLYVSTRPRGGPGAPAAPLGIVALRDTNGDHRSDVVERFSDIEGTGIRFHRGALYAASASKVHRFDFAGNELVPTRPAQTIVEGMPATTYTARGLAFDGAGGLYVSLGGSGNICARRGAEPVGHRPCPDLATRAGVWRYAEARPGQKHPADGEHYATGIRDLMAIDWSPRGRGLYAVMQGRNGMHAAWPKLFKAEDNAEGIAEEMHLVRKGSDLGWPYTYYDGRVGKRLIAPEYGGDGKTAAPAGQYSDPLVALPPHSSPLAVAVYEASQFPAAYRGGAFVALQGGFDRRPLPQEGYNVVFVPARRDQGAGYSVFADGFAGVAPETRTPDTARYRPSGVAVGPDGALYIVDSKVGRIWRVSYGPERRTRRGR